MKYNALIAMMAVAALVFLSGMAAATERASVATDKTTYLAGEDVVITVLNECNDDILLNGFWVEDAEGQAVYYEPIAFFSEYLAPGESHSYSWSQVDGSGKSVVDGVYTIHIADDSTQITIITDPVVVTIAEETLTVGDNVAISLTNTAETPVYTAGGYQVIDVDGNVVYAERVALFPEALMPGESLEYVWAQTTDAGIQVAAGTYVICSGDSQVTVTIVDGNQSAGENNGHQSDMTDTELPTDLEPAKKPVRPRTKLGAMI